MGTGIYSIHGSWTTTVGRGLRVSIVAICAVLLPNEDADALSGSRKPLIHSAQGLHLGGGAATFAFPGLDRRGSSRLELHPFGGGTTRDLRVGGLAGFALAQLSLDEAVAAYLREAGVSPQYTLRLVTSRPSLPRRRLDLVSHDYRVSLAGVPICNIYLRAHDLGQGRLLVSGQVPLADPESALGASAWPLRSDALARASAAAQPGRRKVLAPKVFELTACLAEAEGRLSPAYEVLFTAGPEEIPFFAVVTGNSVPVLQERIFDANEYTTRGTFRIGEFNRESDAVDVALDNLKGDGYLTNKYFTTATNGTTPAYRPSDHDFTSYTADSEEYSELMSFVHIELHRQWAEEHGFDWYTTEQLNIKVHERPGGNTNNALYKPLGSDGLRNPTIFIGDGCCDILEYLGEDSDVGRHEFGHHIVYQHLKSTDGESLVLHEGLADFLAFSHSGDACLGETICPEGMPEVPNGACWVNRPDARCLRTADNSLKLTDEDLPTQGHLRSQFVSGMLWDMREALGDEEMTRIIFAAIPYLLSNSGYRDLILALLAANAALDLPDANLCTIKKIADARGLESLLTDVDCSSQAGVPDPSGTSRGTSQIPGGSAEKTGGTAASDDSDRGGTGCGTVGGPRQPSGWLTWWTALSPLVFMMWIESRHRGARTVVTRRWQHRRRR